MRWVASCGGDDETNATDGVSEDENDAAAEKITVCTSEDESNRVTGGVCRHCMLSDVSSAASTTEKKGAMEFDVLRTPPDV